MILELERYREFLSEEDKKWLNGQFSIEEYESLFEYYSHMMKHWDKIVSSELSPVFQAIFSYVLMIYFENEKLDVLFKKYHSFEIVSNYIMILTRQGKKNEVLSLINEDYSSEKQLLISKVDFYLWQIYFFSYDHDFDSAKALIKKTNESIEEFTQFSSNEIAIKQVRALFFDVQGLYYEISNQHKKTRDIILDGLSLLEKNAIFDSFLLGTLYNSFGSVLTYYGDSSAKEMYDNGYRFFKTNQIQKIKDMKKERKEDTSGSAIESSKTDFEHYMRDLSSQGVSDVTFLIGNDEDHELISIMVILQSGLPCYSYIFDTKSNFFNDELLLAGLLSAIQNFSSEISLENGNFRMLEHANYIILLETRTYYTVVLFIKKFSYILKENLIKFADSIEANIKQLANKKYMKTEDTKKNISQLDELTKKIFLK